MTDLDQQNQLIHNYDLSNKWTIWFHHINDSNWNEDSYTKIKDITSIKDYYEVITYLDNINAGMFFFMKDCIFPRWEDINNMDGGFWSFRVLKADANNVWKTLLAYTVGNTLTNKLEDMDEINGLSISPKINNSIIKIWTKDASKNNINIFNKNIIETLGEALYKKHE